MNRFYYTTLLIMFIFLSGNKSTEETKLQNVVFKVTSDLSNLKSLCNNPITHFALIEIDTITYQVEVFYFNGKIFANTLKLNIGEHTLSMFVLVHDGGSPGNPEDDLIVFAATETESVYSNFVSNPLPFNFQVDAFTKSEVSIEILSLLLAENSSKQNHSSTNSYALYRYRPFAFNNIEFAGELII